MGHDHVIGVAGAGMSAIAHLLLDQGHTVSGCDQQRNALVDELIERGMHFDLGHDAAHVNGVDQVITSSALKPNHPELVAARERNIPVLKRADLWREWSLAKPTLAIAGTHGKTTTTAMCALILQELGYDPAYIVPAGGPVPGLDRFARWGSGPFVIEADEYDRLFLGLHPAVSIITSVDWDHVDIYPTRESVEDAFAQFAKQTTSAVIACWDNEGVQRLLQNESWWNGPVNGFDSYGFTATSTWWVSDVQLTDGTTTFVVNYDDNEFDDVPFTARLQVPGNHNVQNALGAALGVHSILKESIPLEHIFDALSRYRGAARRFEWKGEAAGVTVIDDYAHNPPKVRAALDAAKMRFPNRRLVVYVQPHTFSRTRALIDEFTTAFDAADVLLVGDIYQSRERAEDFPGIDAAFVVQHVRHNAAEASGDLQASTERVLALIKPGDVLLTLGAGDGNKVGEWVLEGLKAER